MTLKGNMYMYERKYITFSKHQQGIHGSDMWSKQTKDAYLRNTKYGVSSRPAPPHLAVILNIIYQEGALMQDLYQLLNLIENSLVNLQPLVHRVNTLVTHLGILGLRNVEK